MRTSPYGTRFLLCLFLGGGCSVASSEKVVSLEAEWRARPEHCKVLFYSAGYVAPEGIDPLWETEEVIELGTMRVESLNEHVDGGEQHLVGPLREEVCRRGGHVVLETTAGAAGVTLRVLMLPRFFEPGRVLRDLSRPM